MERPAGERGRRPGDGLARAQRAEHPAGVGVQRDARADGRPGRAALDELGCEPVTAQRRGQGQASDAAADDQDLAYLGHVNPAGNAEAKYRRS